MYAGQTLFAQLMEFVPWTTFAGWLSGIVAITVCER
jgi:hypothetical protein